MYDKQNIREGATVRSLDGDKLGKVISLGSDSFVIEKGLFFKKDYLVEYDKILRLERDEVILMRNKDELRELGDVEATPISRKVEERDIGSPLASSGVTEETRVPLSEEEIEVGKYTRETGDVGVHKRVEKEQRTVDVPLKKEEVRVERVPASSDTPTSGASFEETTIRIPIREEQADVSKREVVKEELRVTKTPVEETERFTEEVRKEKADVDDEAVRAKKRGPSFEKRP